MSTTESLGAPQAKAAKKKASGSSFYLAMRLMPKQERDAMFAIYAFCRRVDDIADDGIGTRAERHEKLEAWRYDLESLYGGQAPGRVAFLAPAIARFGLRKEDFFTILDGMDMDVAEDIVAPDLPTLDLYCERVASAVGRLSIKVFGMEEGPGFDLAHHLGRALQLTNILRDVREDAERGRLYLPREWLDEAGVPCDPHAALSAPGLHRVCARVAVLAHDHFRDAREAMARCDAKAMKPARLMGATYAAILARLERRGWSRPDERVSLPAWQKLWLALRYGMA